MRTKPYDIYELENDFTYHCDLITRRNHINAMQKMSLRQQIVHIQDHKEITDNNGQAKNAFFMCYDKLLK